MVTRENVRNGKDHPEWDFTRTRCWQRSKWFHLAGWLMWLPILVFTLGSCTKPPLFVLTTSAENANDVILVGSGMVLVDLMLLFLPIVFCNRPEKEMNSEREDG